MNNYKTPMTATLQLASYEDIIQPFLIHHSSVRGRVVRLTRTIDAIISQHAYPLPVSRLLAEMCVLAGMLSSNLKGKGKLTMQLRGDAKVQFMVVDVTAQGGLRGYAQINENEDFSNADMTLQELVGKGYLAITLQKGKTPYQGIVDLDGESLSDSVKHYFTNSEQSVVYINTALARREIDGELIWCAGGILLQQVPRVGGKQQSENGSDQDEESFEEDWNHCCILAQTMKEEEILDPFLSPQALLYRLYNEDGVWVYDPQEFRAECNCSREKVIQTLEQFPQEELQQMAGEDGQLEVKCQFCGVAEKFMPIDIANGKSEKS